MKNSKKKVLVIGGAGYIGAVLTQELLDHGYAVRVFDRLIYGDDGLKEIRGRAEIVVGDMRQIESSVLDDIDAVINVGGFSNDPSAEFNPQVNFQMNALATESSARVCRGRGIKRYIFASSASIYDLGLTEPGDSLANEEAKVNPQAVYSVSKYEGEKRLLSLADENFCPVVLRKGTVFGFSPRMRYDLVVNTFIKDALEKFKLSVFGGGEIWRPLISIKDVAQIYLKCLEAPEEKVKAQVFNLVYKNFRISELALRVMEVLREIGIYVEIDVDYSQRRLRNYRVSGAKIEKALGIKPQGTVEESVKELVTKIRQYGYTDFSHPKYYNIRCVESFNFEESSPFISTLK